jgi:hypothetical protein
MPATAAEFAQTRFFHEAQKGDIVRESPLAQGRGLKPWCADDQLARSRRLSRRAWIETRGDLQLEEVGARSALAQGRG